ncbi:MAG: hypothetical protein RLY93_04625 [Sumerlaeia bacterium]
MSTRSEGNTILRYDFEPAVARPEELRDEGGVFVVEKINGDAHIIVDAGHGDNVRADVESHARRGQWEETAIGNLAFRAFYTGDRISAAGRREIVEEIRRETSPACGPG